MASRRGLPRCASICRADKNKPPKRTFREDVYKHDEALDRAALADAAAGRFVAPLPQHVQQSSNLDSR